jgi:hypothetical protein
MKTWPLLIALCPAIAWCAPLKITATDQGFEAPASVAAGMRHVVFENHGKHIHEVMFVKLPEGMDAAGYLAQVNSGVLFPKGALDYSGPGLTSPGEGTEVWLKLDAGNYVLICWHHSRTSVRPFTVRAGSDPDDAPPKADVVLKLVDFRFVLEGEVRKGTQVIRVETPGPSMHEADIFRLLPGHSAAQVKSWYQDDDLEGPAPAIALGGILDSHSIANVVYIRRNFVPGQYVLQCAMPMSTDAKSGDEHASHADAGMITTFEVKE